MTSFSPSGIDIEDFYQNWKYFYFATLQNYTTAYVIVLL